MNKTLMKEWNPRYTIYAKYHGRNELEQMEHDREEYLGGVMFGFTIWIKDKWREFCTHHGYNYEMKLCYENQFDKWLANK